MADSKPIISLIIPFYNVEEYIAQCLDSVFNQDIDEADYEVICVNDGSPDNSREIVLEYQKRHSNLLLVEHDKNRKLGTARNTGRKHAKGKYLWNIDSDDYIKPNVLKNLIDICEKNQLDVLIFNFYHLRDKEYVNFKYPFPESEVESGIDFLNKYCLNNLSEISPVWTQIYRIEFLNEKNIYSPEINMGEDVPYTYKALLLADRIQSVKKECYVYRINEKSLGGKIEKIVSAKRLYEKCFVCSKHMYKLLSLIPKNQSNIKKAYKSIISYIVSLFPEYLTNMSREEKSIFRLLLRRNFFKDIRIMKFMSLNNKLVYYKHFF